MNTHMAGEPIVAGTDGSETAERAVHRAGELARALGATVHVVSTYDPNSGGAWLAAAGGIAVAPPSDEEAEGHAQQHVLRAKQHLASLGVEASTHVCRGEAADVLVDYAANTGAQMIVVGNRGMSGARRVLGSVPNRVSHRAACAVMIVPTS